MATKKKSSKGSDQGVPPSKADEKAVATTAPKEESTAPIVKAYSMVRYGGAWNLMRHTIQGDKILKQEWIGQPDLKSIVVERWKVTFTTEVIWDKDA